MTKKGLDTAKQDRTKPNAGTKIRTGKAVSARKPSRSVWRIFRFKQRFELPGYCRKSGLRFTRDFVITSGYESDGYLHQFRLLDNGDGLNLAMLKGLYRDLVNMAAQHSKAKRGFLIDADDRPLTDLQIGKLLNIRGQTMRKILRQYAGVKLLEKVELPDFAAVAR